MSIPKNGTLWRTLGLRFREDPVTVRVVNDGTSTPAAAATVEIVKTLGVASDLGQRVLVPYRRFEGRGRRRLEPLEADSVAEPAPPMQIPRPRPKKVEVKVGQRWAGRWSGASFEFEIEAATKANGKPAFVVRFTSGEGRAGAVVALSMFTKRGSTLSLVADAPAQERGPS